jgi:hypothetical protein
MASLKTDGFAGLVASVVTRARSTTEASTALRIALTLDGKLPEEIGRKAVALPERAIIDDVRRLLPAIDTTADTGDVVSLTPTGRVTIALTEAPTAPTDAHILGAIRWVAGRPPTIAQQWQSDQRAINESMLRIQERLIAETPDATRHRLSRIGYAVSHMAPVLLYVGERVYSNLGKTGTLPGKSLDENDPRCVLSPLRASPVASWDPIDACFVACLDAVLASGPPVRAEEFNGSQLTPDTVETFLIERIARYAQYGRKPEQHSEPESPAAGHDLDQLAGECHRQRARTIAAGFTPYRLVNGLNLHKQERLSRAPSALSDVPESVVEFLRNEGNGAFPDQQPLADMATYYDAIADRLARNSSGGGPFGSAFEAFLHEFLRLTAEAFDADVAMSRGPRSLAPLLIEAGAADGPLSLGTGEFFCCVAPRKAFQRRFAGDGPSSDGPSSDGPSSGGQSSDGPRSNGASLARVLAAYSARMRFNTWHYLPHTLGISDEPGRKDWFFAPTMPDLTEWSDQHHTGHVAFGVRYAIRVPFGISLAGRQLPGLYDLRLLRTGPPPLSVDDLRRATATASVLGGLYQAMSSYSPIVDDFDRDWYQMLYG